MLDFINSWALWLGLGGGVVGVIGIVVLLRIFAPQVLEWVSDLIKPSLGVLGSIFGDTLKLFWENFRDGVVIFCKSKKAIFAVGVLICAFIVGVHYSTKHVTEKRTEAKVWRHVRATYRLSVRPKPKTVVQTSLDTLRKSLGGITP